MSGPRTPAPSPRAWGLRTLVALASSVLLVCVLAACSSASSKTPDASAASTVPDDFAPTRASSGLETPLPPAAHQPAMTTTAASVTGFVEEKSSGLVCVHFSWEAAHGAPALTDGLAFEVTEVHVDPPEWKSATEGCGSASVQAAAYVWSDGSAGSDRPAGSHPTQPAAPACLGATLTVDQPSCDAPLVRLGGPHATGATGSVTTLLGHLVCSPPVTGSECARATEALVRSGGSALPVDPPPPARPSPTRKVPAPAPRTRTASPSHTATPSVPASPSQSQSPSPPLCVAKDC
jgi:hypothetical protein